jgi:uncharacterized protein (TIGR02246 family)
LLVVAILDAAESSDAKSVRAVLDQYIRAWQAGDVPALAVTMARDPDTVVIGTDAAEYLVGWPAVESSLRKQLGTFEGTKVSSRDRRITLGRSGTVAWVSELWDITTRAGGESVALSGMRASHVLEKRDGKWLIVHAHYSMPVAGQAVKY